MSHPSETTAAIERLQKAAVRHQFDLLPSSELPDLAVEALKAGLDSPSLRLLAGELRPTWSDSGPLFERVLRELGIAYQPKPAAGLALALYYAHQIVSGTLDPYEGACHIWWDVANNFMHEPAVWNELRIFVGLASEWDDYPPGRPDFERQIRDEAKGLIDRHA